MGISLRIISSLRASILLLLVMLCCTTSLMHAGAHEPVHAHTPGAMIAFKHGKHVVRLVKKDLPTDSDCRAEYHTTCYSPLELQNAYNLTPLLRAGFTGAGQTIVIIDSYGSPTASADLKQFDADYGLPDPPSFKIYSPLGTVPFDPHNQDMVGWEQETNLDVQWAHAMAPGANIVLLTSPVSETEGVQGMPEFLKLEQYALDHKLGNIISQSWGATEETLFTDQGKAVINSYTAFYQHAAAQHITILASAGDNGTANPDIKNKNYPFPTVVFPASSPWVTAVGGTNLKADIHGNYQSETAWNSGAGSATGGGFSKYFSAPKYQSTLPNEPHFRALPDVAYNADPDTGVPVYLGFMSEPGYYTFGGTSAGAPQWAGMMAVTDQMAGHPLGFINNDLYKIGGDARLAPHAFHDITSGDNKQGSVPGYQATPGWDLVTGWGTPKATYLLPTLINVHDQAQ